MRTFIFTSLATTALIILFMLSVIGGIILFGPTKAFEKLEKLKDMLEVLLKNVKN